MRLENFSNDRINYQESCIIMNALNTYFVEMKKQGLSKTNLNHISTVIEKYEKLESKILDLRIIK